jgi:DNA-binding PadR family transcriptional regulator
MWIRAITAASASSANRTRVLPSSLTTGTYKTSKDPIQRLTLASLTRRGSLARLTGTLVGVNQHVYKDDMSMRPLQEPTFLILTALAAGAQHGYGIMNDVAQISGDAVKLHAGTLYAALDRLTAEGLVGVDREEVVDGRLRRYYRLTPPGAGRLAAEVERRRSQNAVAVRRLGLAGGAA